MEHVPRWLCGSLVWKPMPVPPYPPHVSGFDRPMKGRGGDAQHRRMKEKRVAKRRPKKGYA